MKEDPRFTKASTDPRFRPTPSKKKQRLQLGTDARFQSALETPLFREEVPVDRYGRCLDKEEGDRCLRRMVGVDVSSSDSDSDSESGTEHEGDVHWGVGQWAANPDEDIPMGESTDRLAVVDMDWSKITAVDLLVAFRSFAGNTSTPLVKKVTVYLSDYGMERLPKEDACGPSALGIFHPATDEMENEVEKEVDMEQIRKYEKSKLRYYYAVVECASVSVAERLMQELDGSEFEASNCCLDLRYVPDGEIFEGRPAKDVADSVPEKFEGQLFECNVLQKTNVQLTWDDDDDKRTKTVRRRFTEEELEDQDFKAYLGSESDTASEEDQIIQDKYRTLLDGIEIESDVRRGSKTWEMKMGSAEENISDIESESSGCLDSVMLQNGKGSKKVQKDGRKIWNEYQKRKSKKITKQKRRGQFRVDSSASDSDYETSDEEGTNTKEPVFFEELEDSDKKEENSNAEIELLMIDDKMLLSAREGKQIEQKSTSIDVTNPKRRMSRKERLRKTIQEKKEKREETEDTDFKVDVEDPRFSKLITSSDFALDPTDPAFRRTSGSNLFLSKVKSKQRKRKLSQF